MKAEASSLSEGANVISRSSPYFKGRVQRATHDEFVQVAESTQPLGSRQVSFAIGIEDRNSTYAIRIDGEKTSVDALVAKMGPHATALWFDKVRRIVGIEVMKARIPLIAQAHANRRPRLFETSFDRASIAPPAPFSVGSERSSNPNR